MLIKRVVGNRLSMGLTALYSFFVFFLIFLPTFSFADDSVCARVKIEIRQELTLERQAFDAHMGISNGLSHITLENVDVDVKFSDEDGNTVRASYDPNDTDALFFIRLDSMENINDVNGSGTVDPSSTADIHWLIIPAPGASNGLEQGKLYYVGATLSYTIGGEEHVTEVTPDYIFVKPMPELALDYFLPTDVYGDDAFTPEIEPTVPFSLGVRVQNNGSGVARNMKINSAQPKIIENEQGLLINFNIEGTEVNGQVYNDTLLVNFGDIEPNASAIARWIMTCSISGQFVEFKADYSHADELGGELTSLLEAVNTHFLVRDVLVDLPGRDTIRDFLAKDGAVYRVYESDSGVTEVLNQSGASNFQFTGQSGTQVQYTLSTPITAGFMYVQVSDLFNGQKMIKQVVRSDGKTIKPENAWISKTRDENHNWQYFVNLFDVNTTGSYTFVFDDLAAMPQPPVLQFIPDRSGIEDQQLSFIVEASDPNGTIPMLSASPLPVGAVFADQGNGVGIFDWTPAEGQSGSYVITFIASDGVLTDSQRATLTISSSSGGDSDGDGMADAWEMLHFENLDRDGTGDFDGDGISDLDEYLNGTDPKSSNAPSVPVIFAPEDRTEVANLQPELTVQNSIDPDGDAITYEFELYDNETMGETDLVTSVTGVPEDIGTTSWTVPSELNDNAWYYWRVRATDGKGYSQWAYGSFFINTANDAPGAFYISSPLNGAEVDSVTPTLEVTNSLDVDEDMLTYRYEVYADETMSTPLVVSVSGISEGESGTTSWVVDTELQDNTWYFWKSIVTDDHGASTACNPGSFFVNTFNDAPVAPTIVSPVDGSEVEVQDLDLVINNSTDVDGDVLTYFFELDKVNTFDSESKQTSGPVQEGAENTTWYVSNLDDNTYYFWRVRANDGAADSEWMQGSFFVNIVNDAPSTPTLKNPGQEAWIVTLVPALELNPSVDLDNDSLIYRFELYADSDLTQLVAEFDSDFPEWIVPQELTDNTWYYWRAQAEDEHGLTSEWMETASFFTDSNGINDPPTIVIQEPSEDLKTDADSIRISWEDSDPETDAEIALYYDIDGFGEDGILIVNGLMEDPDEEADDSYLWDITAMAEGTYYIYGTVTDGNSSDVSYAPGAVTIARPPEVGIDFPEPGLALQDNVTFTGWASDDSGVAEVYLYLREDNGSEGIPIGYENLVCIFNESSGNWEYDFDTTQLQDGYYLLIAKAIDIYGNEGVSEIVRFSIRNWAVLELLPASETNKAGRTMPVKFSLRIAESVDPAQPFVYNEKLKIIIYDSKGKILQTSLYGDTSKDYRIDTVVEKYITNFKTSKKPDKYVVEIWRLNKNFMIGSFSFETVK